MCSYRRCNGRGAGRGKQLLLLPVEESVRKQILDPVTVCHISQILQLHIALTIRDVFIANIASPDSRHIVDIAFQFFGDSLWFHAHADIFEGKIHRFRKVLGLCEKP